MNEGYPGLSEALQINNNKPLLPISIEEMMSIKILVFFKLIFRFLIIVARKNLTNNNDGERYFTVETTNGYIVINREYENIYLSLSFSNHPLV
jgi:hypothetical protein